MSRAICSSFTLLLAVALVAQAAGRSPRFGTDDPVWVIRDLKDASGVQAQDISLLQDGWNGIRGIGDAAVKKALDVNSVDEVPDSSWFENRLVTRPMSPAEIVAGPSQHPRRRGRGQ